MLLHNLYFQVAKKKSVNLTKKRVHEKNSVRWIFFNIQFSPLFPTVKKKNSQIAKKIEKPFMLFYE